MISSSEFFIHASQTEKQLFVSCESDNSSPRCMTPDDVDFEMAAGKHPEVLEIHGMNQQSFEHFVKHYAKTYRSLSFFKCQLIQDFSPLEDLTALEQVSIYWNIRADRLWNFSKNNSLRAIFIDNAKRLTLNPDLLRTSATLNEVSFSGDLFQNYPMESLECFAGMPELRHLQLNRIRLNNHSMEYLKEIPKLERFDFDAGMLSTEEIARIVAKCPHLSGQSLCAYNKEDAALNDVRVCGSRKPGLDLPQHQKRLDKYIAQFNALVEKYRNEP